MDRRAQPDLSALVAGALDWWREAGVDHAYEDEARQWVEAMPEIEVGSDEERPNAHPSPRSRKAEPPSPPAPEQPAFDLSAVPTDLTSFAQWWLTEPALCEGSPEARVTPRGSAGAEIMIVVSEPEREDRDTLLSGPQGRLLDAMLAAMEIAPEQAYRASVLPRHMPGADWNQIARGGLGEVVSRHVCVVAPKRLMVFGANILPLLGNDLPQGPADLRIFNHERTSIPLLACRSLAALLERPRWKAGVWQAWLDWTG